MTAESTELVTATSTAQRMAWAVHGTPEVEEVAEGTWAIPMSFDVSPIRFTYAYLVIGDDGAILIDPGAGDANATRDLDAALASIGVDRSIIRSLVVTHFHLDHWAFADELAGELRIPIGLGAAEWAWQERLTAEDFTLSTIEGQLRRDWGVPEDEARIIAVSDDYELFRDHRKPELLLKDGDRLALAGRSLRVVATPGHTPGHICVYDEERRLLFSGDHILPRITPNVPLNPFGLHDPLGDYLRSLRTIADLEVDQVLPAHEYAFTGSRARIDALSMAAEERLDEVRQLPGDPSPWESASQLIWSRPWSTFGPLSKRMALGETAAYLRHLDRLPNAAPR